MFLLHYKFGFTKKRSVKRTNADLFSVEKISYTILIITIANYHVLKKMKKTSSSTFNLLFIKYGSDTI